MALLKDIKKRRIELGFKQKDMQQRIGVSRQQYQQIESKGNPQPASWYPWIDCKGLKYWADAYPQWKKRQALSILNEDKDAVSDIQSLIANPSQGLLGDEKLGDREWPSFEYYNSLCTIFL